VVSKVDFVDGTEIVDTINKLKENYKDGYEFKLLDMTASYGEYTHIYYDYISIT